MKMETPNSVLALARADLACYAIAQYPSFELAAHHRVIVDKLEAVERGEIQRLMFFMPPRHGKSLLATQMFPAWYLGRPSRPVRDFCILRAKTSPTTLAAGWAI